MKRNVSALSLVLVAAGALFLGCELGNEPAGAVVVNHLNWNASAVPDSVITQVKALDVYFEHASVGNNVQSGLATLAAQPGSRYTYSGSHFEPDRQPSGAELTAIANWFDTHNGFVDFMRGNPGFDSKLNWFESDMQATVGGGPADAFAHHADVVMFKFCWIDDAYISGSAADEFDNVRTVMERLEAQFPRTRFVWWTMPLFESGNAVRIDYNTRVRDYCAANNKLLIDIADIECHNSSGNRVTDGSGNDIIWSDYTYDGGHLTALGEERLANAFWVMLARIAGWNP
jgi:hypothetical protein